MSSNRYITNKALVGLGSHEGTWTFEQCDDVCRHVIEHALVECKARMIRALNRPDEMPDLTEVRRARRRLERMAATLQVEEAAWLRTFDELEEEFREAKSLLRAEFPEFAEHAREATRLLASEYATCLAYARAIEERLPALLAAKRQRAAAASTIAESDMGDTVDLTEELTPAKSPLDDLDVDAWLGEPGPEDSPTDVPVTLTFPTDSAFPESRMPEGQS